MTSDLQRCYQVMACDDRRLLDLWMEQWQDLVAFLVVLQDGPRRAAQKTAAVSAWLVLAVHAYRAIKRNAAVKGGDAPASRTTNSAVSITGCTQWLWRGRTLNYGAESTNRWSPRAVVLWPGRLAR